MLGGYERYRSFRVGMPVEGVLCITLDRPGTLNALDKTAHAELSAIWPQADGDARVRSVLLNAEGRAFSAGGDFTFLQEVVGSHAARVKAWHEVRDFVHNILNCTKPIVSAIQGPAVGGGLAAALLADISIASRTARLLDGHTRLGVVPGDHALLIWPLLCSLAKVKYHLMLCEPLTGAEAERIGLVSLAVDAAELQQKALDTAARLAEGAPTALRWTKHALNNWMRAAGPHFDTALALELIGFGSPDAQEGLAALQERRRPDFRP